RGTGTRLQLPPTPPSSLKPIKQFLNILTRSLESLSNQQSEQQAQLVQLVNSIKEMSSHFRATNLTDQPAVLAPTSPAAATPQTTFPVSKPDKFSGNPDQCRGFLLQCSVFFDNSPVATDQAKISFVVSRLAGKALDWATASWSSFSNWTYGSHSVVEYALEFRTLAASSGWNEAALLVTFRQGLKPEILNELASRDDLSLDQLISLAIKLDHLLNSRKKKESFRNPKSTSHHFQLRREPTEGSEPMLCDSSRLSQEERQHRLSHHLCLFCGGHYEYLVMPFGLSVAPS
uniref:DUF4939 domain-containing protein n=1 Tax=Pygocentrus nattereri TaxID=42514 RepID=A0AAR2JAL2_PYGNA